MKAIGRLLLIIFILFISTSFSVQRIDYREGMNNNVCKTFRDNVLVYLIFVDTKETKPWTDFDIQSTLDSMNVAVRWLESQAIIANIPLNIKTDYYIGLEYSTIRKNLEYGTVEKTATTPNIQKGLESLNKWADGIAARVGKDVQITVKDGIPEIKNPKNKERLIAHLRDKYEVESIALLYLVNNYFRNDISLTVNQFNNENVEFCITSYKYPSILAQNLLNLFGAADLYKTIYRRNDKKIKLAQEYFPNDIMQDVYAKDLSQLEIGKYTQYLIGWTEDIYIKYQPLLTDNIVVF